MTMKEAVLKKVRAFISETHMIVPGEKVLVALSGGADSVAMAHILLTLSRQMNFSICAAHLNHCLRGEESDYDELFVRNFCSSRGIELAVERADVGGLAKTGRQGIEECARNVRYDFLYRSAASMGAARIATAHTLSDNAETVIFNIARGSGLNGLCGIPEMRGKLIRPMLKITRAETESYDKEVGLPFVLDGTNLDTDYTRNYIRKEIVSRLSKINPAFLSSIERLTTSVKEDNAYIEREAERLLADSYGKESYRLSVLAEAAPPLLKRALSKMYSSFTGRKLSSKALNAFYEFASDDSDGRVQLPGAFAVKYNGRISLASSAERKQPKRFYFEAAEENVLPDGRRVTIAECESSDKVDKRFVDADKISGKLRLRLRVSMDELKLPKRPTKSLKKLFSEKKVPIEERDRAVVLCDDMGIVWVQGLGVAERAAAGDTADKLLKIKIEE